MKYSDRRSLIMYIYIYILYHCDTTTLMRSLLPAKRIERALRGTHKGVLRIYSYTIIVRATWGSIIISAFWKGQCLSIWRTKDPPWKGSMVWQDKAFTSTYRKNYEQYRLLLRPLKRPFKSTKLRTLLGFWYNEINVFSE